MNQIIWMILTMIVTGSTIWYLSAYITRKELQTMSREQLDAIHEALRGITHRLDKMDERIADQTLSLEDAKQDALTTDKRDHH
ncbi:MAG: hypothetical protein O3A46_16425 [Candidatus Poribacteria bacterium]|nr:hypothetical protein [Candidatus Poribacteria bacterium]